MQQFNQRIGTARIHGIRHGRGTPIVFLHAGVTDSRMYSQQLKHFSADHTAIAYDRRGFGQTTTSDEPFRHEDDLASLLQALDVGPAVICGCSQGARVAIDFALAQPGSVSGLILVGATYNGAPWQELNQLERDLVNLLDLAEAQNDIDQANELEAQCWLDGPKAPAGRVRGKLRELFLAMNKIALAAPELTQELEGPAIDHRLGEITCPTLLIDGDLDFVQIRNHHTTLDRAIPNSTRVTMPGTAHLPPMEQPERFNQLASNFMQASG